MYLKNSKGFRKSHRHFCSEISIVASAISTFIALSIDQIITTRKRFDAVTTEFLSSNILFAFVSRKCLTVSSTYSLGRLRTTVLFPRKSKVGEVKPLC